MTLRLGVLLLLLLGFTATPSHAHTVGVSRGDYRADGKQVRADIVFAGTELAAALPALDADGDGALSSAELQRGHQTIVAWIQRGIAVRVAAGPCAVEVDRVSPMEQDGVEVAAAYRCPGPASAFVVRLDLLEALSLGHRHLLAATSAKRTLRAVLYEAQPEYELAGASVAPAPAVAPALFRLGVEHILTGYDHLLFLLALVLVGGSWRAVLGAVTAFTLAHSVTLAVAALGIWSPRPTFIEPAIALSIAYVGIENFFVRDIRRRWRLTFAFGLVHGFGFAGALREVALSAAQLPLALASFNAGVEAGQLAVLALVLPGVSWLAARAWFARGGRQLASAAISAAGVCWFVVRVTGW
jgi:hydrogenase/urease accessory protein HupE